MQVLYKNALKSTTSRWDVMAFLLLRTELANDGRTCQEPIREDLTQMGREDLRQRLA